MKPLLMLTKITTYYMKILFFLFCVRAIYKGNETPTPKGWVVGVCPSNLCPLFDKQWIYMIKDETQKPRLTAGLLLRSVWYYSSVRDRRDLNSRPPA